jgi:murein DD-endopeptidase MepM/ murein hydrolase activator NlpD
VTAVNTPAIDNDATFPSNPLAEMVVTSSFGVTRTIKGLTEDHGGTDLRASVGTPFFAVADGVVERAEFVRDSRSGFLVQLRTDNGYIVQYLHCDEASTRRVVPVGQKVLAGQQIGFTGNTPGTVDPHLHIQVFKIAERNLNKTGALTGSSRGTKLDVMPLLPKTRVARS